MYEVGAGTTRIFHVPGCCGGSGRVCGGSGSSDALIWPAAD